MHVQVATLGLIVALPSAPTKSCSIRTCSPKVGCCFHLSAFQSRCVERVVESGHPPLYKGFYITESTPNFYNNDNNVDFKDKLRIIVSLTN